MTVSSTTVQPIASPDAQPPADSRKLFQRRAVGGQPKHFRPDIQALRTIAVLLVVVVHLRPSWMPGGYIGVDVFFVISGYLITSHMLREAERTGSVRLGAFWAARARRILPAALVTIAITVITTALLFPPPDREQLRAESIASIFYFQNWQLAGSAVDYMASDNAPSPFQHYWSLAVEEQFYLLWPILVALAAILAATMLRNRVIVGRHVNPPGTKHPRHRERICPPGTSSVGSQNLVCDPLWVRDRHVVALGGV